MKRTLTLIASVLSLIMSSISTFYAAISSISAAREIGWYQSVMPGWDLPISQYFTALAIIYSVSVVLSVLSICVWKIRPYSFRKVKFILIAAIVVDLFVAFISFCSYNILLIIVGIVLIAAIVLLIVDLVREKSKAEKLSLQIEENTVSENNKKIKRPLILIASILGLTAGAVAAAISIISLIGGSHLLGRSEFLDSALVSALLIIFVCVAVCLAAAVSSGVSIAVWNKEHQTFKAKKEVVIFAIVFSLIAAIVSIITLDLLLVILAIILIAAAVLFIIDLAREKAKIKKLSLSEEAKAEQLKIKAEQKAKQIKRPLVLTAGILGLTAGVIAFVLSLISAIGSFRLLGRNGALDNVLTFALIIICICVAVYIVATVLSGVSIGAWKKDPVSFSKKKGVMITAIVFAFIAAIVSIITLDIFLIILGLILVAAAVLFIVDLAREKNKIKKSSSVAETKVNKTIQNKVQAADELAQKLGKIELLKEKGILSEVEFEEIKKEYLKEYLSKI